MLPPEKVATIKGLLAEGIAHKTAAAMVGVSKSSVDLIAQGRRPDYDQQRKERATHKQRFHHGPIKWCVHCGAHVYGECIVCKMAGRPSDLRPKASWYRPTNTKNEARAYQPGKVPIHVELSRNGWDE